MNYVTDEQVAQSITLPREAKGLLPWFLAHDSEELGSSDILVPFSNGVSLLRKRPFREEVHRLVRSGQAAQAAALVENVVRRPHLDGDAAASALTSNYLDMALCMVSETMFDDALVMLKRVAVDPRSVLELLPEIMDLLRGMFSEQPNDVVAQHGSLEIMGMFIVPPPAFMLLTWPYVIVLAYLSDNFPEADESFGREFLLAGKRMFAEYLFWYRSRPKVDTELVVVSVLEAPTETIP